MTIQRELEESGDDVHMVARLSEDELSLSSSLQRREKNRINYPLGYHPNQSESRQDVLQEHS